MTTADDWADEAESAERAEAWSQAAALWMRAAVATDELEKTWKYTDHASRCRKESVVTENLADIARRVLGIDPLSEDSLDFADVNPDSVLEALRLAYRLNR